MSYLVYNERVEAPIALECPNEWDHARGRPEWPDLLSLWIKTAGNDELRGSLFGGIHGGFPFPHHKYPAGRIVMQMAVQAAVNSLQSPSQPALGVPSALQ